MDVQKLQGNFGIRPIEGSAIYPGDDIFFHFKITTPDGKESEVCCSDGDYLAVYFLNQAHLIEAGTDCVGFAQRAASWDENPYVWANLPKGWAESDSDNIWDVLRSTESNWATYYRNMVRSNNANDVINKDRVSGATALNLEQLRRVVPGDVWLSYSVAVNQQDINVDNGPGHIAIVAYVPSNAHELDTETLMSEIILIESTFTNKIQSVINKLSVGDYNNNLVPGLINIYPGFRVSENDRIGLNCQSWAIRRLK